MQEFCGRRIPLRSSGAAATDGERHTILYQSFISLRRISGILQNHVIARRLAAFAGGADSTFGDHKQHISLHRSNPPTVQDTHSLKAPYHIYNLCSLISFRKSLLLLNFMRRNTADWLHHCEAPHMANIDSTPKGSSSPPSLNTLLAVSSFPVSSGSAEAILTSTPNEIPPTNSETTKALWGIVRCRANRMVPAPRRPKVSTKQRPKAMTWVSVKHNQLASTWQRRNFLPPHHTHLLKQAPPKRKTYRWSARAAPSHVHHDKEFSDNVLRPRGISIKGSTHSLPEPFLYFIAEHTASTIYAEIPGLEDMHFGSHLTILLYKR
jgi:hypothetical protein